MTRRPSLFVVLPFVVIGVAAIAFVVQLSGGPNDEPTIDRVVIEASGPVFATVSALAAASDRVIIGTVTAVGPGRTIADPSDPNAGVVTQLATVDVETVLIGSDYSGEIVVEQEATLLDGTPIVVNGARPLEVGDRGVAFLIAGGSEEFPYFALTNEQSWLALRGGPLRMA